MLVCRAATARQARVALGARLLTGCRGVWITSPMITKDADGQRGVAIRARLRRNRAPAPLAGRGIKHGGLLWIIESSGLPLADLVQIIV